MCGCNLNWSKSLMKDKNKDDMSYQFSYDENGNAIYTGVLDGGIGKFSGTIDFTCKPIGGFVISASGLEIE